MVIIGLIGVFLPGLPTTPFMIVAAACFVRSSERCYNWVINNRIFGKAVREYRSGEGMPLKIKVIAWSMMWVFGSYSVLMGIPQTLLYVKLLVLVLLIIGTVFIYRIPSKS
tara:strand:- start:519 stop:851 length:333 start_codon:yes stop_codon:yes gene_type:complete